MHASWQAQATAAPLVCSGTNALLYALGRTLIRHTKAQTLAVPQLPPKSEESLAGEAPQSQHCLCVLTCSPASY